MAFFTGQVSSQTMKNLNLNPDILRRHARFQADARLVADARHQLLFDQKTKRSGRHF